MRVGEYCRRAPWLPLYYHDANIITFSFISKFFLEKVLTGARLCRFVPSGQRVPVIPFSSTFVTSRARLKNPSPLVVPYSMVGCSHTTSFASPVMATKASIMVDNNSFFIFVVYNFRSFVIFMIVYRCKSNKFFAKNDSHLDIFMKSAAKYLKRQFFPTFFCLYRFYSYLCSINR